MSNNIDDSVDREIEDCLNLENPQSFFLFAGAGSGKTRSLVCALNYVKDKYRNTFLAQGKHVGVITYTNAACNEIIHRTEADPIFRIATIHGFCWSIIQGLNEDIRNYLKSNLNLKVEELTSKVNSAKNKETKTYQDNCRKLEKTQQRLKELDSIHEFTYNPNANTQFGKDSLDHTEVIDITTTFLKDKITFKNILIQKYPFLLIDESQDTHHTLIDALLELEVNSKGRFLLGLIGDEMQRIYLQGKKDLSSHIGGHWKTPQKVMNHRSQKRIIELANIVRQESDLIEQKPRSDKQQGHVHLFVIDKNYNSQANIDEQIMSKMFEITGDLFWKQSDTIKRLYLEHRMAAIEQGFIELYDLFYEDAKYKSALLDGTISELTFFSKLITPLMTAYSQVDQFSVIELIRNSSSVLKGLSSPLSNADKVTTEVLADTSKSMAKLYKQYLQENCTFLDVLTVIKTEKLFTLPINLEEALDTYQHNIEIVNDGAQPDDETLWMHFLKLPYEQLTNYTHYISGESAYDTHHGVKGREFDRVLVVMNDHAKRGKGGLSASYEKLFGVANESETDVKNALEGKETDLQRTRRLFYVTCTRAKESLALVVYTDKTELLKNNAIEKKWFLEDEITLI